MGIFLVTALIGFSQRRPGMSTDGWNAELGIWEGARAVSGEDLDIPDPLYIFGYGSLCWKAEFKYQECWIGNVQGWQRRFAQRSTDHRGTPESPGLVVTLLTDEELAQLSPGEQVGTSSCYGVCYKVGKDDVSAVLDALDFREKGGCACDLKRTERVIKLAEHPIP